MILDPRPTPQQWVFIYRSWIWMSYAWQAFGVLWIVWGLWLTVWMSAAHDTSRLPLIAAIVLAAVLILPTAGVFFGARIIRRWPQRRLAAIVNRPGVIA